ncbi:MAG: trigger factor [Bacteroidota bacterium]|nr:trigger factor [Bacteroidota bacterium]MDP4231522.1 trigger factor [Bacteroidota bacterium]
MEAKITNKSQVLRELEIFVGEDEVNKAFDEAYKTMRPKLALPGFRPGKAPMSVVKKLHGDAIEGDTLEKIAQEKFKEYAEEQKLEPIGRPVMTDLHRHAGEGAHFKISYEVKPEFDLKDYNGLEAEAPIYSVTDKDVEERIHYLRFNFSTREEAQEVSDTETIVNITFQEKGPDESGVVPPPQTTDVYLHDPQVVPELRDGLIGKKVSEKFEITLPKTSDDPKVEKKDVPLDVTINKAEKVILPEMNEDFCKKISRDKATNELEVRLLVREELEENAKRRSTETLESNMVNALLKMHDFQVPRTITHALLDTMIQEVKDENKRRGYPEDYGMNEEEYRKMGWNTAETRGKWLILRDRLVEAENLEANEEDIAKLAERDAEQYGIAKENLLKYYLSNDEIKEKVKSEKLVARLREKMKIVEKPVAGS